MDPCTTFTKLPPELLHQIFGRPEILSVRDFSSLERTCRHFRLYLTEDQRVWEEKFKYHYPKLFDEIRNQTNTDEKFEDWRTNTQKRFISEEKCRKEIFILSKTQINRDELSDECFQPFVDLSIEVIASTNFVEDSVRCIIYGDKNVDRDLTLKYYGKKVLRFLVHRNLSELYRTGLSVGTCRIYEQGSMVISRWYRPLEEIDPSNTVYQTLDEYALRAKAILLKKNPCHPIAEKLSENELSIEPFEYVQKKDKESVLDAVDHILYREEKFKGNEIDYYRAENSLLDKVIESKLGIPITLSVLYMAVAGRLGLAVSPVNYPGHFLLSCQLAEDAFVFIDTFNDGSRMYGEDQVRNTFSTPLAEVDSACFRPARPYEVFQRMGRNLSVIAERNINRGMGLMEMRTAFELMSLFEGDFPVVNTILGLCEIYLEIGINYEKILADVEKLVNGSLDTSRETRIGQAIRYMRIKATRLKNAHEKETPKSAKKRPTPIVDRHKDVIYGVGMVMKHQKYDYDCVIYGWDKKCAAGQHWIKQMKVDRLPLKDSQPFYNVLVSEDGSMRYAAQENLLPQEDENVRIDHNSVGKYFNEFKGKYYAMNEATRDLYPDEEKCLNLSSLLK